MTITGAQLFVKALKKEKVTTLFAYPGGQVIDLFHALYGETDIQMILPRHEQGLIHAADGYARSTGKTGVCLVTSGPGAANLVTGIATAGYDSVPLVCFTGQVPTGLMGHGAFQELDMAGLAKNICKYAVMVQKREALAREIQKAFYIAKTGKPGVAVVVLPKDIQQAYGSGCYEQMANNRQGGGDDDNCDHYYIEETRTMDGWQIQKALDLLAHASRPLFLAGGGVRIAGADREMTELARRTGVPVVTTIMGKGAVPSADSLYIGNIGIHGSYAANCAVSGCDVLFAIGTRFNDRITGSPLRFAANATVVHINIDAGDLSRNVRADLPVAADAKEALSALLGQAQPLELTDWLDEIKGWDSKHPLCMKQNGLTPQKIMESVNDLFPESVIVTDVGQNQMWAAQFLELNEHRRMLTSGGFGTMGYGFPAAIGAKLGNPDKDVIVISGDGGIQMNIQEMATAVVCELPLIICILNNGYLGNVRQWQELFYDGHYSSTCMRYRKSCGKMCGHPQENTYVCPAYTPDFIRLAKSYGAHGIRVMKTEEIKDALISAKKHKKTPTVIEFIIERELNVMPVAAPGNALHEMILE